MLSNIRSITLVSVETTFETLPDESTTDRASDGTTKRPTMCRNCGSIVGGGQQQCAVCGANVRASADTSKAGTARDNETVRFARAVLDRPYKFTIALLIANLFVFILMFQSSGMTFSVLNFFPFEVLVAYGAKVNYLIREQHQWWRFVTPMFIHLNLLHLMVNMYSLWVVGPYVEKLYGSAKFVVFWIVTGVAGVVASYLTILSPDARLGPLTGFLFKTSDPPSAGASGALFGLVGVLFVFGIKFRRELPEGFKRAFGTGLLPMILLNLFIGYVGRGFIDNAAHLGGLVAGAFLALLVDYRRPGERSGMAVTWRILQIACLGLVAVSFIKTAQHLRDALPPYLLEQKIQMERVAQTPPVPAPVPEPVQNFVAYAKAMTEAQEAFNFAQNRGDVSRIDEAVRNLQSTPHLDPTADDLQKQLTAFLLRAKTTETSGENGTTAPNKKAEAKRQLNAEFVEWLKAYRSWLETTGRNYGLVEAPQGQSPQP
jgi:rhomboid protease GluP